jgi:hypothetical protein
MLLLPNVLNQYQNETTVLACAPIYDRLSLTFGSTANKKLFTAPFPLFCNVILCDNFASCDDRSIKRSTLFAIISGLIESNVAALHSITKVTKIMLPMEMSSIIDTICDKTQPLSGIVPPTLPYRNTKAK